METKQKQHSLQQAMHYLASITFVPAAGERGVPAIGLIFGNPGIASNCQRIAETFEERQIRLSLKAELVTGELTIEDSVNSKSLATGKVNIDFGEIKAFLANTPEDKASVLAFGFRSGCDFVICPAAEKKDYHPILLSSFVITLPQ
jgi:hypothetical protein